MFHNIKYSAFFLLKDEKAYMINITSLGWVRTAFKNVEMPRDTRATRGSISSSINVIQRNKVWPGAQHTRTSPYFKAHNCKAQGVMQALL